MYEGKEEGKNVLILDL